MKLSKHQLKRIIREEKNRILEMQYDDADTQDPRKVSDLLMKINDAVDALLAMGMKADSVREELYGIAESVTELSELYPGQM